VPLGKTRAGESAGPFSLRAETGGGSTAFILALIAFSLREDLGFTLGPLHLRLRLCDQARCNSTVGTMAVMFDLMKQIYALLNVKRMQVEFYCGFQDPD